MPAIATPATAQAATNQPQLGAHAIPSTAGTANSEPSVITGRGPTRSSTRPTGTPTVADTTSPAENAAVVALIDQPVSAAMLGASTGKA